MTKRKRSSNDDSGDYNERSDASWSLQTMWVMQSIEQGKKLLNRALKLAKGFERQKLGRRRKIAQDQKDEAETKRIDSEVEALKALDLPVLAQNHIFKTMLKTKSISSSPALPDQVKTVERPQSQAAMNVTARMYNSNPVKKAISEIMSNIRQIMAIPSAKACTKQEQQQKTKNNDAAKQRSTGRAGSKSVGDERDSDEASEDKGAPEAPYQAVNGGRDNDNFSGADDADGLDFPEFEGRLAASSDEDSGEDFLQDTASESLDGGLPCQDDGEVMDSPDGVAGLAESKGKRFQVPPTNVTVESPQNPKEPPAPIKPYKSPDKPHFLPSLSLGGYWSGSESEPEDDPLADQQQRRNRRGQRARQQIWEKKFGSKAKHLQTQKDDRDHGWDPRRGAKEDSSADGRHRRGGGRGRTADGQKAGAGIFERHVRDPPVKNRDDEGPLHPSWEAKKKAKAKKETANFEGKKVTFD